MKLSEYFPDALYQPNKQQQQQNIIIVESNKYLNPQTKYDLVLGETFLVAVHQVCTHLRSEESVNSKSFLGCHWATWSFNDQHRFSIGLRSRDGLDYYYFPHCIRVEVGAHIWTTSYADGAIWKTGDCKVIWGEKVARQHRTVVCRITLDVQKRT